MSDLETLLALLDKQPVEASAELAGWQVTRIGGGANNLLYRATNASADYAVKFTLRDARRRAEREYRALRVLEHLGLDLAARPVLLDNDQYTQPVVVQTWLAGDVLTQPPQTDADWQDFSAYLAAIHSVKAKELAIAHYELGFALDKPVLFAETPEDCREVIRMQLARLPLEAQPADLQAIVAQFMALDVPDWGMPPLTLTRADPNPRNYMRRAGQWASVDWEYSGVTDPAYEIGDVCAHPAYMHVPHEQLQAFIEMYAAQTGDAQRIMRIRMYWRMMVVWWVVRFAQYAYEIPRGLDQRLVARDSTWQTEGERKYQHYVALAQRMLAE